MSRFIPYKRSTRLNFRKKETISSPQVETSLGGPLEPLEANGYTGRAIVDHRLTDEDVSWLGITPLPMKMIKLMPEASGGRRRT